MELNKTTYNYIAEGWLNDHKHDVWSVQSTKIFADFFMAGDSVLDVGCGPGIKAKVLFQKGLAITGIDFSESMIAIAKREVPQGEFQVMDINDLSGLQREFDGIFAQAVLLHIPRGEVLSVLKELMEKLKLGGYFYWYNVLEKTLEREIKEEVGLEIKNTEYLTSLATVHEDGTPPLVISCIADYASAGSKSDAFS